MAGQAIKVAIVMGSKSDWEPVMKAAADILGQFGVPCEARVLSAHRTPKPLEAFIQDALARGCEIFIAGAGGAAHLAGVVASMTIKPVLGVPVESTLNGLDSLLSMVQMPADIPVGCLAIGKAGAKNAALLAIEILAVSDTSLSQKLHDYRKQRADEILAQSLE
jgi:5-(carboxyamino)imidazole ribonucleotide mutase